MYQSIIVVLVGVLNFLFSFHAIATEIMQRESQTYSVTLTSLEDCHCEHKKTITLHVMAKRTQIEKDITFANTTVDVIDLYLLEDDRLVVHGKLGSGGDILTIINIESEKIIDIIWGWDASVSPDSTKIAYNFRYPPHAIPLYRTSVLLMYDLTKSPEENTMDESKGNPVNRGFILWPDKNRTEHTYFIPAMSYEEQQHIMSPIVWNTRSSKVCFLLRQGDVENRNEPTYLVIVDIANGLLTPQIHVQEVDATLFYEESALKSVAGKPIDRTIPAEELRFTDNDQAVEIKAYEMSPFDGNKRVIIPIHQ